VPNEAASTENGAFAAHFSAVTIKRSYSNQGCNLATIELS